MSNGMEPADFEERLDEAAETLEAAETEDDLDAVEATLDDIQSDLDETEFEIPEAEDEEEDPEDPTEALEDRLDDLRSDLEDQRGPYVDDVTSTLGQAEGTIRSSEWTEEGEDDVATAVSTFFETASDSVAESFSLEADDPDEIAEALGECADALEELGLDPDDDAEEIDTLLTAAEDLTDNLDEAQVFGDLEIREQLRRLGIYDVLDPENRKDFPPEWSAIKIYESRGEVEPLLTILDKMDSAFMEENVLDALEHIAPEDAYEDVHALAKRRNKQPVRILGRIGDERACDTLVDFLGGGDVKLEQESLRALGAIGCEDSTEAISQRLAAEKPTVRAAAARSLGLIGDTRAIEPLADALESDEADSVRASAAWALNQIGTRQALDAVAEHADDRSYLVQVEAEKAMSV